MFIRSFILGIILTGMVITSSYGQDKIQDTSVAKEDVMINIPFGKLSNRTIVSDITAISPEQSAIYDNVVDASSLIYSRVPGLVGSLNIRGLGNALVVIDGVPSSISFVNANEIEQVTILKDVNASMLYGVQGNNGVIQIKTKRGKAHERIFRSTIEAGVSNPISYPKYLGAAEYMGLYNEALSNDGLAPLYSTTQIDATKNSTDPIRYPDVDYYNSGFLKNYRPDSRFQTEISGGNDNAQYYLNLGWLHTGSIMANKGINQHEDRLNIRSNVDIKVTSFIKANVGVVGIMDLANAVQGNFFSDAATIRPNAFPGLIDSNLVNDKNILGAAKLVDGKFLVGGTSIYRSNPFGYLNSGGYNKRVSSAVRFSTGLDFDLKSITRGLSFKANFIFDNKNNYTESQANSYAVYDPNYSSGVLNLTKIGKDETSGIQSITSTYLDRRTTVFLSLDYQRVFQKEHAITASLIGYGDKFNQTAASFQGDKHAHLGSRINYVFKNKYIFDFSSSLVASAKLPPNNRVAFSPSVGLGWVLSDESFLKENTVINFLKLRVSGGITNTDQQINNYYLYEDIFGGSGGYFWNDGNRFNNGTRIISPGNANLFYEKRKEFNFGFNSILFDRTIWLDATVFWDHKTDLLQTLSSTTPDFIGTGGILPLQNFGENKYTGLELGLTWKKSINDFSFDIGSTLFFTKSKVVKTDEFWDEKYLYRAGKSISSIFGLQALGLFKDVSDIANSPNQEFGNTQPGDIKYKDQNGDGVINDDDQVMLGISQPSFVGGLSVKLSYKNFTLFALGTVQSGSDRFYNNSYYWIYGDRKYSEMALDRWTPATSSTATYPRLTSQASSNNFRSSSFWLYDNSVISLDRLQLTYEIPRKFALKLSAKNFNVFVRASNIADFSKNKKRQQLNIAANPQYRYYAAGLKVQF